MSAIGDYIHYTAYGYNVYGINRIPTGGSKKGKGAGEGDQVKIKLFNQQRRKVQQQSNLYGNILSPQQRSELETFITNFMDKPQQDNNQFWDFIAKKLGVSCTKAFRGLINSGKADLKAKMKKINQNTKYTLSSTIEKRLSELDSIINEMNGMKDTPKSLTWLKQQKIQIYNIVAEICGYGKEVFSDTQEQFQNAQIKKLLNQLPKRVLHSDNMQAKNLIDAINEAAAVGQILTNIQKGTLWEYVVPYAILKGIGYGTKTVLEELEKTGKEQKVVTGATTSKAIFNANNFYKGTEIAKMLAQTGDYKKNVNKAIYESTNSSQNKVDIQLEYHGKNLKMSAKNINLYAKPGTITLVDQTTMLSLVQNMDPAFVTHWLNAKVIHKVSTSQSSRIQTISPDVKTAGDLAMKLSLLTVALTGHKNTEYNDANIFIINNNNPTSKDKRVSIFNIADIINYVLKNLQNSVILDNGSDAVFSHFTPRGNLWVPGAGGQDKRIINVLMSLHAWKISVKFSSEEMRKMMNTI